MNVNSTLQAPTSSVAEIGGIHYPAKILLSVGAEEYIEKLGDDLVLDNIQLWQLSPALLQFYTFAFDQGRESLRDRIDRLEWERDLFYFCFANKKRPGDYYTHLTNELWAGAH